MCPFHCNNGFISTGYIVCDRITGWTTTAKCFVGCRKAPEIEYALPGSLETCENLFANNERPVECTDERVPTQKLVCVGTNEWTFVQCVLGKIIITFFPYLLASFVHSCI